MVLVFDITKIPRSTTREEWIELHRWRRLAQKRIEEAIRAKLEMLLSTRDDFSAFGTAIRRDIMDNLINPPLLLGSYQTSDES